MRLEKAVEDLSSESEAVQRMDGGIGMLQALGFGFMNKNGQPVPFGARGLEELETITDTYVIPELKECEFRIACDVTIRCVESREQVLFTDRRKEQRHL